MITMPNAQSHFDKAIHEIEHRNQVNRPAVDLSIQRLDNGAVICTRERIVKEVRPCRFSPRPRSLVR